ncbi:uncharacterized protein SCHCODRAFT_02480643, partial [Schizophyllum commune H4-8]|uniref:uncharacterized protein n=1 Tax=Schizophyllum commune (strain H4-8 / FGSC 9210) TaxID=578458 RepID=UPI00215F3A3F
MKILSEARAVSRTSSYFTHEDMLKCWRTMLASGLHVFLVVDALDEALDEKVIAVLETLRLLPRVSILFSNRICVSKGVLYDHCIQIDQEQSNTDICTALDIAFSEDGPLSEIPEPDTMRRELALKAGKNMRWTVLVINQLRSVVHLPHKVWALFHRLPPSLEKLYARCLADVHADDREEVRRLLIWILHWDKPPSFRVTVDLLSILLAFDYSGRMPVYIP